MHVFSKGETVWSVVKQHLFEINEHFKDLSVQEQNYEISKYVVFIDKNNILPNVNLVNPGDTLDLVRDVDGKVPENILKTVSPLARLFTTQP